jgi:hypothetical protein
MTSDIIHAIHNPAVGIKQRSFRVEIENPTPLAVPTISFHQERVPVDAEGNPVGAAERIPSLSFSFASVANEEVTLDDGRVLTVADIAEGVKKFYLIKATEVVAEDPSEP